MARSEISVACFATVVLLSLAVALDLTKLKQSINVFDTGVNGSSVKTSVKSGGPNVAKAKKIIYLTGLSFCLEKDLKAWNCTHCLKAKENGYEFGGIVQNKALNTFGVIAINKAEKEIAVAYRGSCNVPNLLQDAVFVPVPAGGGKTKKGGKKGSKAKGGDEIKVHAGFKKAADSLWDETAKKVGKLLKANKGFTVTFTGHSLGASIAIMNLYTFRNNKNFAKAGCTYYGFGEPRTGNKAFADYWNNQKGCTLTRIVNKADIFPHIPNVALGFLHHGTELWINPKGEETACSKSVYEDSKCSNSLGPLYNPLDHVQYWDVNFLTCAINNPMSLLGQLVLPLPVVT